jgi:hypothetical protein
MVLGPHPDQMPLFGLKPLHPAHGLKHSFDRRRRRRQRTIRTILIGQNFPSSTHERRPDAEVALDALRLVLAASAKRAATASIVHSATAALPVEAVADAAHEFAFEEIESLVLFGDHENALRLPTLALGSFHIDGPGLVAGKRGGGVGSRDFHLTPPAD